MYVFKSPVELDAGGQLFSDRYGGFEWEVMSPGWPEGCPPVDMNAFGRVMIASLVQRHPELILGRWRTAGHLLPNGGRLYPENADIPEIGSPLAHIQQLPYYEQAAEQIGLMGVLALAKDNEIDTDKFFPILKKQTLAFEDDNKPFTIGHHNNLLVKKSAMEQRALYLLMLLHGVSRALFCGAGMYHPTEADATHFDVAQKLQTVNATIDTLTTTRKPLINLRHEPHADPRSLFRYHDVPIDALVSPWAQWFLLASTSLVIRQPENDLITEEEIPQFADPIDAAHAVAHDETALLRLKDGRDVRAVDVSEMLLEFWEQGTSVANEHRMEELREQLPQTEQDGLLEWRIAVDEQRRLQQGIKQGEPSLDNDELDNTPLANRSQRVRMQSLARKYWERSGGSDPARVGRAIGMIATTFTRIYPMEKNGLLPASVMIGGKSVRTMMSQRHAMPYPGYQPADLRPYIHEPPANSRASSTVAIARQLRADGTPSEVDWGETVTYGGSKRYSFPDPRSPEYILFKQGSTDMTGLEHVDTAYASSPKLRMGDPATCVFGDLIQNYYPADS